MPITMVRTGETVVVRGISGSEEEAARLAALGFEPGAKVMIVSVVAGSLVLETDGNRIALEKAMAEHILI